MISGESTHVRSPHLCGLRRKSARDPHALHSLQHVVRMASDAADAPARGSCLGVALPDELEKVQGGR